MNSEGFSFSTQNICIRFSVPMTIKYSRALWEKRLILQILCQMPVWIFSERLIFGYIFTDNFHCLGIDNQHEGYHGITGFAWVTFCNVKYSIVRWFFQTSIRKWFGLGSRYFNIWDVIYFELLQQHYILISFWVFHRSCQIRIDLL